MSAKLLFVLGTRPEAIKLAPVIRAVRERPASFTVRVCATGQHRELLTPVCELFGIQPDLDLRVMQPGQTLAALTARLIEALDPVLRAERPAWVIVQGDTTTVWVAALVAFYHGIRVAHVEAGLRTSSRRVPFPEELNRRLCTQLADLHFAPTAAARARLLAEGVPSDRVLVTGNTVVDALQWARDLIRTAAPPEVHEIDRWLGAHVGPAGLVLVTGHRRESFGGGFERICHAIAELAARHPACAWVYPVHLNPAVQEPVRRLLGAIPNVHLIPPQPYAAFVRLMDQARCLLTDSGGIQEEAPTLGRIAFVMRDETERGEGLVGGGLRLVGTSRERIVAEVDAFLRAPAPAVAWPDGNPYGDGRASQRIADALAREP